VPILGISCGVKCTQVFFAINPTVAAEIVTKLSGILFGFRGMDVDERRVSAGELKTGLYGIAGFITHRKNSGLKTSV